MATVSIFGTGNVAKHLFDALMELGDVEVVQVIGRNERALASFGKKVRTTTDFSGILDADIFLIAVKDDAIPEVSGYLRNKKGLTAHTSGSVSMEVLSDHDRYGVFYPLQSFSEHRKVDMGAVPFCLEANTQEDMAVLKRLAGGISDTVYEVDSGQRKSLHLAAVFVNNFTNHLFHIGQQICREKGLPFELLHPLIRETVDKIEVSTPQEAQTGPARRGDSETVSSHLEQLKKSDYLEVYKVLSESLLHLYRS